MVQLVGGLAGFSATVWVFWLCLPKHGNVRPFLTPNVEPYIAVGITFGIVLSLAFVILGLVNLFV